jgi:chemotaxis protein methyltransferase CheR
VARGARRPLRIWSAGCCTGEEAYSIALALRMQVPHLPPERVDILATDLNDAFLEVARAGVYRRWSFRRTDPAGLAAYFRPLPDGRYELDAGVRGQVRFAHLNLADAAYPAVATGTLALDVIFCRNVLMYFGREQAARVVARLRDCLVDGGWLVVNASEASTPSFPGFTAEVHEDAVFFRKNAAETSVPAPAAAPPVAPVAIPVIAPVMADAVPAPPPPVVAAPQAHPEDPMARAQALAQAGRRDEALQCARRAAEAEAASAPLQQGAALFALEHGDRQLARHCVRRLLYLEPDSAIGHYLSALLEDAAGRRPRARSLLRDCRRLAVDAELQGAAAGWLERLA